MATPTTELRLLTGYRGDRNNLYRFGSKTETENYILSLTKYTLNNFTYLRGEVAENSVRVPYNIGAVANVNYIAFRSAPYDNRWYFASVENIVAISPDLTEITYKIDTYQTYMWDINYKDCYIEREHTTTDEIGEHVIDENLDIGQVYNNGAKNTLDIVDCLIIIASTKNKDGVDVKDLLGGGIGVYNEIPSQLGFFAFFDNQFSLVADFISSLDALGQGDAIYSIFFFPEECYQDLTGTPSIGGGQLLSRNLSQDIIVPYTRQTNLRGYVPRNKKLFTYPYNYVEVTNNNGGSNIYRFEDFFNTETINFGIRSNLSLSPTLMLFPFSYKEINNAYDESLILTNYPNATYVNDYFSNWLAQNAVTSASTLAGSVIGIGTSVATGNPIGAVAGVGAIVNQIGAFRNASIRPDTVKGMSAAGAGYGLKLQYFTILEKCLKPERAILIDKFFDKYGYKVVDNKVPNIDGRPYWNFVKCIETSIYGNIPTQALKDIRDVLEEGVTFWHTIDIGEYSYENAPL